MPYNSPLPEDSILFAILTVAPNRQKRGIFIPTTPDTTGPRTTFQTSLDVIDWYCIGVFFTNKIVVCYSKYLLYQIILFILITSL